jgi:ABC-2 type transport system ATP-binding protein
MTALEISGITFSYDVSADKSAGNAKEFALKDFTMSVPGGSVHALLGPNGAGKTTLMRVITGQIRNYEGAVSICGRKSTDPAVMRSVGYAPQPISLFASLTAMENLRFFGAMAGLSTDDLKRRSPAVLEETGLSDYAQKRVSTYSGGMLRRLNLAVALLHSPALLLLDEPTAGVDPQSRHHIYETLNRLNAAGMTVLLCTHIMDEAQRLCSQLTLLDKGKVVFSGDMTGVGDLEKFFLERTGRGLRDD